MVRSTHLTLVSLVIGVLAVACRTTPPAPPDPPKASRAEVLQTLHQCLVEIPRKTHDGFISPCAYRDISALSGISRTELVAALGGYPACQSHKKMPLGFFQSDLREGPECEQDEDPYWMFFTPVEGVRGGGYPKLVCEAENTVNCVKVVWKKS